MSVLLQLVSWLLLQAGVLAKGLEGREGIGSLANSIHSLVLVPKKWASWGCLRGPAANFIVSFFLIGGKFLYNVLLFFAVQQHESAIIVHISPPFLSFPHLIPPL